MNILVIGATFLAAGVEWVEALTIVLAVGLSKGWRSAFAGAVAAIVALVALVAGFGLEITSHVSIGAARTVVGVFLLLFGLKWLHKAILRASGLKSLHDEAKVFAATKQMLEVSGGRSASLDRVGVSTSFGGVFLEGLEVVFIVVALGGLQDIPSAVIGAAASLVLVVGAGVALRVPLTAVPENAMKFVVGIMLTSFGTFFAGEGIGVDWWREDLSLLPLILAYGLASLILVQTLKRADRMRAYTPPRIVHTLRVALLEVWGLFVDDGALVIMALAALLAVSVFIDHVAGQRGVAAVLLVAGVLGSVTIGVTGSLKGSRSALGTTAPSADTASQGPAQEAHEPEAAAAR
jgi:uncharacterized membrane protein